MFVRNNTKCPNCGSCYIFDMSVEETGDYPDWSVRLECIDCSWGLSYLSDTYDMFKILSDVYRRHQDDVEGLWIRSAFGEATRSHDSVKECVLAENQFVKEFVRYVVKKNAIIRSLADDQLLQNVVNYFVSKPERKRRYRSQHFLRTVGL